MGRGAPIQPPSSQLAGKATQIPQVTSAIAIATCRRSTVVCMGQGLTPFGLWMPLAGVVCDKCASSYWQLILRCGDGAARSRSSQL